MLTDDECRKWFDDRDKLVQTELDKILEAERETVAAKVARLPSRVVVGLIEMLRDTAEPAHLDQDEADPRKSLRKWEEDDHHFRVRHGLADLFEQELLERLRHGQRLH